MKKIKKVKKRPLSIDQQPELFQLPEDTPKVGPEGEQQLAFPKPVAAHPAQPQESIRAPDLDIPPTELSKSNISNAPLGNLALQDSEGINGDVEVEDDDFDYEDAQI